MWNPCLECLNHYIEMIIILSQSVTEAREKLCLDTIVSRRKKIRHNILWRLLSNEEHHHLLVNDYDELCSDNPDNTPTTRAITRGVPPTIYAKTSAYYNSFLPKTVREIKKWFMQTRNNCAINTIMTNWCMLAKILEFKRQAPWNFSLAQLVLKKKR